MKEKKLFEVSNEKEHKEIEAEDLSYIDSDTNNCKVYYAVNTSGYKSLGLIVNDKDKKFQVVAGQKLRSGSKTAKKSKKQIWNMAKELKANGYDEVRGPSSPAGVFEESKKTEENREYQELREFIHNELLELKKIKTEKTRRENKVENILDKVIEQLGYLTNLLYDMKVNEAQKAIENNTEDMKRWETLDNTVHICLDALSKGKEDAYKGLDKSKKTEAKDLRRGKNIMGIKVKDYIDLPREDFYGCNNTIGNLEDGRCFIVFDDNTVVILKCKLIELKRVLYSPDDEAVDKFFEKNCIEPLDEETKIILKGVGRMSEKFNENKRQNHLNEAVFEIDYATGGVDLSTEENVINSVKAWLGDLANQVKVEIKELRGPGAGWPVVRLIGDKEVIGKFLNQEYNSGIDSLEDTYELYLLKESEGLKENEEPVNESKEVKTEKVNYKIPGYNGTYTDYEVSIKLKDGSVVKEILPVWDEAEPETYIKDTYTTMAGMKDSEILDFKPINENKKIKTEANTSRYTEKQIKDILESGKVIKVGSDKGAYTPTSFYYKDNKVYYNNKDISFGWNEHPQTLEKISKHIARLNKEGFEVTILKKKVEEATNLQDRRNSNIEWYKNNGYEEYKTGDNYLVLINKTKYENEPVALMLYGKTTKPNWHYRFKNIEELDQYIDKFLDIKEKQAKIKADRREQRKLTKDHNIQVGDIYFTSWGYDQTNIDYYEVVATRGVRIDLKQLHQRVVGYEGQEDLVEPAKGANRFVDDEIRTVSARADGTLTPLSSFEYLYKWDGKPDRQTNAYFGH